MAKLTRKNGDMKTSKNIKKTVENYQKVRKVTRKQVKNFLSK